MNASGSVTVGYGLPQVVVSINRKSMLIMQA